jgi:hypothetical protein
MKVSFDFDGTLQLPIIQEIAKRHIHWGDEVHITTTRSSEPSRYRLIGGGELPPPNQDLFAIAKELGIPEQHICFTKSQDKVHFLTMFDIHYDDDEHEIDLITRSELKCTGILVNYKNYALDQD